MVSGLASSQLTRDDSTPRATDITDSILIFNIYCCGFILMLHITFVCDGDVCMTISVCAPVTCGQYLALVQWPWQVRMCPHRKLPAHQQHETPPHWSHQPSPGTSTAMVFVPHWRRYRYIYSLFLQTTRKELIIGWSVGPGRLRSEELRLLSPQLHS